MWSFLCLLWANCLSVAPSGDRVSLEQAEATRSAATPNAAAADRCVAAGRSAEVDHCVVVGRYVVAGRDAAADRFVALELHTGAFHDAVRVEIRVALNVARSAVPNAVRRFSWGDFRSVVLAVAQVAVRLLVQSAAQVCFPETKRA